MEQWYTIVYERESGVGDNSISVVCYKDLHDSYEYWVYDNGNATKLSLLTIMPDDSDILEVISNGCIIVSSKDSIKQYSTFEEWLDNVDAEFENDDNECKYVD